MSHIASFSGGVPGLPGAEGRCWEGAGPPQTRPWQLPPCRGVRTGPWRARNGVWDSLVGRGEAAEHGRHRRQLRGGEVHVRALAQAVREVSCGGGHHSGLVAHARLGTSPTKRANSALCDQTSDRKHSRASSEFSLKFLVASAQQYNSRRRHNCARVRSRLVRRPFAPVGSASSRKHVARTSSGRQVVTWLPMQREQPGISMRAPSLPKME
eukprot:1187565-Prorocentrum_minimum.AAC.3